MRDKRKYKREWMRRYRAAHPDKFLVPQRPSRATKPKREECECSVCHKILTPEHFIMLRVRKPDGETWEGLSAECRSCRNKRFRTWYAKDPAKQVKRAYDYVRSNPHAKAAKNNRDMIRYMRRKKKRGCPPWADQEKIETIYMLADFLTKKTGTAYEVDHIYPLIHKHSCGLHVPWNMRIITAKANQAKGNRICAH
jgi:hypothetical protein